MNILEATLLGALEGLTEFLPISSTGHLTIAEKLLGYSIDDPDVTAFTAIVQLGAVLATLCYLAEDIVRLVPAWLRGIFSKAARASPDYRFGWAIILGSAPIALVGLAFKDEVETTLRNLWFVAGSLIAWSGVMWLADRVGDQTRHESDINWKDTLFIGAVQCLALIPGVSRSGATMSAGLFRGIDRVAVTRLAFFLSIPALTAAGALQVADEYDNITHGIGWPATLVATLTSFVVAYRAVSWLLRFVASHGYTVFILYRILLGAALLVLLATGTITAT